MDTLPKLQQIKWIPFLTYGSWNEYALMIQTEATNTHLKTYSQRLTKNQASTELDNHNLSSFSLRPCPFSVCSIMEKKLCGAKIKHYLHRSSSNMRRENYQSSTLTSSHLQLIWVDLLMYGSFHRSYQSTLNKQETTTNNTLLPSSYQ